MSFVFLQGEAERAPSGEAEVGGEDHGSVQSAGAQRATSSQQGQVLFHNLYQTLLSWDRHTHSYTFTAQYHNIYSDCCKLKLDINKFNDLVLDCSASKMDVAVKIYTFSTVSRLLSHYYLTKCEMWC